MAENIEAPLVFTDDARELVTVLTQINEARDAKEYERVQSKSVNNETALAIRQKTTEERVALLGKAITSVEGQKTACGIMVEIKSFLEAVDLYYEAERVKRYDHLQEIYDKKAVLQKPMKTWYKQLEDMTGKWETAEEKRKAREQAAIEAVARKAAEEARKAEAEALQKVGAHEEAAFLEAEPLPDPVALAPAPPSTFAGVSFDKVFKWREVNHALVPPEYTVADKVKLDAKAKETQGTAVVAGIEFYWERKPRNRG